MIATRMQIDPKDIDLKSIYKLITGIVIPRPIGWVSTRSQKGIDNLAPFSFFNAISHDPPHIILGISSQENSNQDTLRNILDTGEFVINMVTEDLLHAMDKTGASIPSDESEFELAQLTPIPAIKVSSPRVKESPVHLECTLAHHYQIPDHQNGGSVLIVGQVVQFHIKNELLLENFRIDTSKYNPVARLEGIQYASTGNPLHHTREN